MSSESSVFEGWAILELIGHRRLAGYVREQELAGTSFVRLDVPGAGGEDVATQFYAPHAVYCLPPTTEELARQVAARAAGAGDPLGARAAAASARGGRGRRRGRGRRNPVLRRRCVGACEA